MGANDDRSRSPRTGQHNSKLIDGKKVAAQLCADIRLASLELQSKYGCVPGLVIIEVGDHNYGQLLQSFQDLEGPDRVEEREMSHTNYASLKAKMAERCAMRVQLMRFSECVAEERLLQIIQGLMADSDVHGILVELPLPAHLDETRIMQAIGPSKDVDGLAFANLGRILAGGGYRHGMEPTARPAVPTAIMELLLRSGVTLAGKTAVVLGRSNTVGAPVAALLTAHDCTVTVCHSQTPNVESVVRTADILVACAGKPKLVKGSWLKPGAVVIDVGMNSMPDAKSGAVSIVGDVCFEEAVKVVSKITPVPGGMGHTSFAILLRNVLNLARQAQSLTKLGVGPSGHEFFRCADQLLFPDLGLKVPQILLPRKGLDLTKWCVIACDQYTSQPDYWKDVKEFVGEAPSTLHLIFPEVYLGDKKHNQLVIQGIKNKMYEFDRDRLLVPQHPGFVLIDRKTPLVESRKGLLVALDLELYSYEKGSQSLIRPTEKTIPDRLPPRVAIREQAPLELPHILVLIDDPDRTVIEPLMERKDTFEQLYDFELMKKSGHLTGWHVAASDAVDGIVKALRALAAPERFRARYGASEDQGTILFPVGDGNHSLATAKRCWEDLKMRGADPVRHPARHALVELVNIHDPGMTFEPIHRLVFGVNAAKALDSFVHDLQVKGWGPVYIKDNFKLESSPSAQGHHHIEFRTKGRRGVIVVERPNLVLEVATLTAWLDPYLAETGATVDYVHGEDVISAKIAEADTTLAFMLPIMDKNDLVKTVVKEGVLPRKTFSMGAADEKRFYFECQRIVPEFTFYKSDFFRRGSVSVPLAGRR